MSGAQDEPEQISKLLLDWLGEGSASGADPLEGMRVRL